MKTLTYFILVFLFACNSNSEKSDYNMDEETARQYVFQTTNLKRYKFPTHYNDLIIDRSQSSYSEAFMVIIEPNTSVFHHKHDDTEQIFYFIEGTGVLCIGEDKKEFPMKSGDVARIPLSTMHSIENRTSDTIKYLCVDSFTRKKLEATWDEHVRVVCKDNGWDYNEVVSGR